MPSQARPSESKFDPPGGGLGYALMQTANAWRSELAIVLAPASVTPPQFFVIAALLNAQARARPEPTQKELTDRTGIDVNTVSQIVRGLERRGIVRRLPHPRDSRAVTLSLTEAGLELGRLCTREARALNRRFFAPADAEPLLHTLRELTARSRSHRDH
jgi:MarR family transcriptional regulator, organic hydroperoxide resistance regulator